MSLLKKIEDKKREKRQAERNKKMKLTAVGLASGAILGTTAGILLAPKSGKETITDLKEKTKNAKETINKNVECTKEKINESKDKVKEYLDKRKNAKSDLEEDLLEEIENVADVAEEMEALEV